MPETTDTVKNVECPYCGMIHKWKCPLVRAIEYHPNGTIKRVEFNTLAGLPEREVPHA